MYLLLKQWPTLNLLADPCRRARVNNAKLFFSMFRSYHSTPNKWIFWYSNYIGCRNWEMTSRQSRQRFVVNNPKLNKKYTPHTLFVHITTILCVYCYFAYIIWSDIIRMLYLHNIATFLNLKLRCKVCHSTCAAVFLPSCTPKMGVLASCLFLVGTTGNENMWRIPLE